MDIAKEIVLDRESIESRVSELAREISADYAGKRLILIGVLNGVFMFFSDLIKNMTIPLEIDFIRVASYGAESKSSGNIEMTKDVEIDLQGTDVLVIEDIADSGLTLNWIKKHFQDKGAASVKFCVLIDKKERREIPLKLDYSGFKVEEGFLVGYGLDFNGQYRYLTEIYHLLMD